MPKERKQTFFLTKIHAALMLKLLPHFPFFIFHFFQNNDAVCPSAYQNTCQVLVPKELPLPVFQGISFAPRLFINILFSPPWFVAVIGEFYFLTAFLFSAFNWATWLSFMSQRFCAFKVFYFIHQKTGYSGWCWAQCIWINLEKDWQLLSIESPGRSQWEGAEWDVSAASDKHVSHHCQTTQVGL